MKNPTLLWRIGICVFCLSGNACTSSLQAADVTENQTAPTQMQAIEKSWQLLQLLTDKGMSSAYPGATLVLQQGKVSGNSSCNHYAGTYQLHGQSLQIRPEMMSMMACAEVEKMTQEQRYFELLGKTVSYQHQQENLRLLDAQGKPLLIFNLAK
jgi:heat shock protein HslJ